MRWLKAEQRIISMALVIALIGFLVVFFTMPGNHFNYRSGDVALSPIGMAISKTYQHYPENAPDNFQGYVENGEYKGYFNWPPLSFKVLAVWFRLTDTSDIFTARILSALVYAINGLLFFFLLIKNNISKTVTLLTSLVFLFLPIHLHSSYFIYADIWPVTFWLLALLLYNYTNLKYYWLFVVITMTGFFFHWFIIIILPFPLLIFYAQKKAFSLRKSLTFFAFLILLIIGFQALLYSQYPEAVLLKTLNKHSAFGFFLKFDKYLPMLLKRLASLGYEGFFLIPLLILYGKYIKPFIKNCRKNERFRNLSFLCLVMGSSLSLFMVIFLRWFSVHRFGIGMFSIMIGLVLALVMSAIEKHSVSKAIKAGLLSIAICCVLYFSVPLVTDRVDSASHQDHQIANFVNGKLINQEMKALLFFDVGPFKGTHRATYRFALKEYTGAYIFEIDSLAPRNELEEYFIAGFKRLDRINHINYDPASIFLITDAKPELGNLQRKDSVKFNTMTVYHLGLSNKK